MNSSLIHFFEKCITFQKFVVEYVARKAHHQFLKVYVEKWKSADKYPLKFTKYVLYIFHFKLFLNCHSQEIDKNFFYKIHVQMEHHLLHMDHVPYSI